MRSAGSWAPADGAGDRRRAPAAAALGGREFAEQAVEFAVEDCRHVSARLERALLAAGAGGAGAAEADGRHPSSARTRGKSDPIDALAIARAALREPDLPGPSTPRLAGAEAAGRPPRGPGRRAHRAAEPAALAAARARSRVRHARPRPGPAPAAGPGSRPDSRDCRQLDWRIGWPGAARRHPRPSPAGSTPSSGRSTAGHPPGPAAARPARLRAADRRQAGRRDGQPGPVPLRGLLRDARRRRTDPGLLRARRTGTGWPAAATDSSTPPCTASRSPRSASTASAAPTTSVDAPRVTPRWKPSARSSDASPGSCSTCFDPPTSLPRLPPPQAA